jgi:hypothetical protein
MVFGEVSLLLRVWWYYIFACILERDRGQQNPRNCFAVGYQPDSVVRAEDDCLKAAGSVSLMSVLKLLRLDEEPTGSWGR